MWKSISRGWPTFSLRGGGWVYGKILQVCLVWGHPFENVFSELFSINRNEEAYVADLMKFSNGVLHWDLSFIRVIQDWELDSLSNFMESVYGVLLRGVGKDKICWMPAKKMSFEVGLYYRVLTESSDQSFPWKSTWKPKDLSRVAFLFGLQVWARFWQLIIYRSGEFEFYINV